MEKHRGKLARVDSMTASPLIAQENKSDYTKPHGQVRDTAEIDVIQIGSTLLKHSLCEADLLDHLEPGREACLYIFRHFHWTPIILGVKYAEDGTKYLASSKWIKGRMLQYCVVWPTVAGIGGAISGGLVGRALGIGEISIGLGAAGGFIYGWWIAFQLWKDYGLAEAD